MQVDASRPHGFGGEWLPIVKLFVRSDTKHHIIAFSLPWEEVENPVIEL